MAALKIAALFYGVKNEAVEGVTTVERVVIEITEEKRRHHYVPYALDVGKVYEIPPVGNIDFDPESALPPPFVLRQFKGFTWKKLR